jgi:hypothetical protein
VGNISRRATAMNFNPGGSGIGTELPSLANADAIIDKKSQGTLKPKSAATSKRRIISAVASQEQNVSSPRHVLGEQLPTYLQNTFQQL